MARVAAGDWRSASTASPRRRRRLVGRVARGEFSDAGETGRSGSIALQHPRGLAWPGSARRGLRGVSGAVSGVGWVGFTADVSRETPGFGQSRDMGVILGIRMTRGGLDADCLRRAARIDLVRLAVGARLRAGGRDASHPPPGDTPNPGASARSWAGRGRGSRRHAERCRWKANVEAGRLPKPAR